MTTSEELRNEITNDDATSDAKTAWLLFRLEIWERNRLLLPHYDLAEAEEAAAFRDALRRFMKHLSLRVEQAAVTPGGRP